MSTSRTHRVPIDLSGLSARHEMFTVSTASRCDPNVEAWLTREPVALRSLARQWFLQMRQCGDDVLELMHDGCPVACIGNAPFGYVNSFKNHVNIGFFNGADLKDPAKILEGSGKRMRHVRLQPGTVADEKALTGLINASYQDMKQRFQGIA